MSVERETRRAIRWMALWRGVTAVLGWFEDFFQALANVVNSFRNFWGELSKATFALEQEHARRYFALTGLDPARADGDDGRYREIRIAAGVEERGFEDFDEPDELEA